MPIATPEVYADMLDRAKNGSFAYPAINITSSQTVTAAIRGFAEAGSDGIIQVSTGGGEYASGSTIKDMVTGAKALAAYAEEVAKNYPVNIALHTDHCPKDKLDSFVRPSSPRRPSGSRPVACPSSRATCGTAPPCRSPRTCRSPRSCSRPARRPTSSSDRGRRRGRRGGRGRERDQRQALLDARGRHRHRACARVRRERLLHDRAHLRQRPRRLQAGQRQAPPGGPRPRRTPPRQSWAWPPGPSPSTWSSTAARARCRRRSPTPSTTAW